MISKPVKKIYKIFSANKRVHVKYIVEESYERHRDNQWAWTVIDLGDVSKLDKGFYIFEGPYDFGTGDMAEKFIISEQEAYDKALAEWQAQPAELLPEADNDNYTIKLNREKQWRLQNLDGKVFK